MAKPIKITPTLTGIDAINFHKQLKENKGKKIDKERISIIRENAKVFNH